MLAVGLKFFEKEAALDKGKVNLFKHISFSSDFIIFDDLERLSDSFPVTDFMGFVNTYFIEHTYRFELNIETIIDEYIEKIKDKNTKQFFSEYKNEILFLLKNTKLKILELFFTFSKCFHESFLLYMKR